MPTTIRLAGAHHHHHHHHQASRRKAVAEDLERRRRLSSSHVTRFYENPTTQVVVAALIFLNFVVTVAEAQLHQPERLFRALEWIFFGIFWVELLVNVNSSASLLSFSRDPWNVFDAFVVFTSTVAVALKRKVQFLRLVRVFRVFRLFHRVRSLKTVVDSVLDAIPGVAEDMVILLASLSIFALVAAENFRNSPCSLDGFAHGGPGACPKDDVVEVATYDGLGTLYARSCGKHEAPGLGIKYGVECRASLDFGHQYFGNFAKALYTLFQTMVGDSWSEKVARPLLEESPWTAAFFVAHVLVHGYVLLNVVVAVLLDEMVLNDSDNDDVVLLAKEEPAAAAAARMTTTSHGSFDDDDQDDESPKHRRSPLFRSDDARRLNAALADMETKVDDLLRLTLAFAERPRSHPGEHKTEEVTITVQG